MTVNEAFKSENYKEGCSAKKPTFINRGMLNNLVRDLTVTNNKPEILGSRLK